ncbi:uncharacterized protein K452DRAFT_301646 [Aplosporella prunicola CBS 121167]|uniref:C2H2-type domain-containing protein n=1 Tax=Aplosporella prunicola CBS 121167 TaxID=1176127 RepID=A0A6A6B5A1_9PEZI|nr:uncharacterized protein K452DRAFT_301646 [Aplosporella prunicola CBS 121167]KAF2137931.1 hypothetical protein K452DRAFT_301646 [Aplosporella prunicola CBS 121167]
MSDVGASAPHEVTRNLFHCTAYPPCGLSFAHEWQLESHKREHPDRGFHNVTERQLGENPQSDSDARRHSHLQRGSFRENEDRRTPSRASERRKANPRPSVGRADVYRPSFKQSPVAPRESLGITSERIGAASAPPALDAPTPPTEPILPHLLWHTPQYASLSPFMSGNPSKVAQKNVEDDGQSDDRWDPYEDPITAYPATTAGQQAERYEPQDLASKRHQGPVRAYVDRFAQTMEAARLPPQTTDAATQTDPKPAFSGHKDRFTDSGDLTAAMTLAGLRTVVLENSAMQTATIPLRDVASVQDVRSAESSRNHGVHYPRYDEMELDDPQGMADDDDDDQLPDITAADDTPDEDGLFIPLTEGRDMNREETEGAASQTIPEPVQPEPPQPAPQPKPTQAKPARAKAQSKKARSNSATSRSWSKATQPRSRSKPAQSRSRSRPAQPRSRSRPAQPPLPQDWPAEWNQSGLEQDNLIPQTLADHGRPRELDQTSSAPSRQEPAISGRPHATEGDEGMTRVGDSQPESAIDRIAEFHDPFWQGSSADRPPLPVAGEEQLAASLIPPQQADENGRKSCPDCSADGDRLCEECQRWVVRIALGLRPGAGFEPGKPRPVPAEPNSGQKRKRDDDPDEPLPPPLRVKVSSPITTTEESSASSRSGRSSRSGSVIVVATPRFDGFVDGDEEDGSGAEGGAHDHGDDWDVVEVEDGPEEIVLDMPDVDSNVQSSTDDDDRMPPEEHARDDDRRANTFVAVNDATAQEDPGLGFWGPSEEGTTGSPFPDSAARAVPTDAADATEAAAARGLPEPGLHGESADATAMQGRASTPGSERHRPSAPPVVEPESQQVGIAADENNAETTGTFRFVFPEVPCAPRQSEDAGLGPEAGPFVPEAEATAPAGKASAAPPWSREGNAPMAPMYFVQSWAEEVVPSSHPSSPLSSACSVDLVDIREEARQGAQARERRDPSMAAPEIEIGHDYDDDDAATSPPAPADAAAILPLTEENLPPAPTPPVPPSRDRSPSDILVVVGKCLDVIGYRRAVRFRSQSFCDMSATPPPPSPPGKVQRQQRRRVPSLSPAPSITHADAAADADTDTDVAATRAPAPPEPVTEWETEWETERERDEGISERAAKRRRSTRVMGGAAGKTSIATHTNGDDTDVDGAVSGAEERRGRARSRSKSRRRQQWRPRSRSLSTGSNIVVRRRE